MQEILTLQISPATTTTVRSASVFVDDYPNYEDVIQDAGVGDSVLDDVEPEGSGFAPSLHADGEWSTAHAVVHYLEENYIWISVVSF